MHQLRTQESGPFGLPVSAPVFWVIALMLVGLCVRVLSLSGSLYLDEAYTLWVSQQRLSYLFDELSRDPNPPFYFILVKYWMELFGRSIEAVRMLSVIFGVLSIPLLYALGRRMFNLRAALAASLLFTLSAPYIHFAQEARGYSMVSFLALLSWYLYFRMSDQAGRGWGWLALVNGLLLLTHYATFTLPLVQGLAALYRWRGDKAFVKRLIAAQAVAAGLLLPWLIYFLAMSGKLGTWAAPPEGRFWEFFTEFYSGGQLARVVYAVLIGQSGILLFRYGGKLPRFSLMALLGWALLGPALLLLVTYTVSPMFHVNYALYLLPAWFLLIGAGLSLIPTHRVVVAAILGLAVFFIVRDMQWTTEVKQDWKTAVSHYKAYETGKDRTFICANWHYTSFSYYYDRAIFRDYRHTKQRLNAQDIHLGTTALAKKLSYEGKERAFALECQCGEEDKKPHTYLESRFPLLKSFHLNNVDLFVYDVSGGK